jgi:3-hydroxyisobutyrate dehydrogenase-like beta-hydroxyacid dehydrogenase
MKIGLIGLGHIGSGLAREPPANRTRARGLLSTRKALHFPLALELVERAP